MDILFFAAQSSALYLIQDVDSIYKRARARITHSIPRNTNSDTKIHFGTHYIVCQTNHQERLAHISPDLCR